MSIMKTQREYILVKEQKGNFHETELEKRMGQLRPWEVRLILLGLARLMAMLEPKYQLRISHVSYYWTEMKDSKKKKKYNKAKVSS